MKVYFYLQQIEVLEWKSDIPDLLPEPKQQKRRQMLVFTDERTELAVGKHVSHQNKTYMVDTIEVLGKAELKAVCREVV